MPAAKNTKTPHRRKLAKEASRAERWGKKNTKTDKLGRTRIDRKLESRGMERSESKRHEKLESMKEQAKVAAKNRSLDTKSFPKGKTSRRMDGVAGRAKGGAAAGKKYVAGKSVGAQETMKELRASNKLARVTKRKPTAKRTAKRTALKEQTWAYKRLHGLI